MIYKIKQTYLFLILGLMLVFAASFLPSKTTQAATLSDEASGLYTFAVPDGGWNTARILLQYEEDYYPMSSFPRNLFSWRGQTYYYKFSGMSSGNIELDLSNFLHTDGTNNKFIQPSGNGATIFDPNMWDYCGIRYNTDEYEYTNTTNYYGQVTYIVSCVDGMPASYAASATIPFKTQ